jgi:hypothetical protein
MRPLIVKRLLDSLKEPRVFGLKNSYEVSAIRDLLKILVTVEASKSTLFDNAFNDIKVDEFVRNPFAELEDKLGLGCDITEEKNYPMPCTKSEPSLVFSESVDRLLMSMDLRSFPARRHLLENVLMEASVNPCDDMKEFDVGLHPEKILEFENPRLRAFVEYAIRPHFKDSETNDLSKWSCLVVLADYKQDLDTHATRMNNFMKFLFLRSKQPVMNFIITDGLRYKFSRIAPRYLMDSKGGSEVVKQYFYGGNPVTSEHSLSSLLLRTSEEYDISRDNGMHLFSIFPSWLRGFWPTSK